ncbi:MAG: phosphotransferase [Rhodospirillaceae bacterium]|jgi:Ser/Thr protein kinase RdoA (MazF antagonist)|nr:phosphotransferase [Rhodospirillaceae bacterium]MBT5565929.1 phosphotransferase [Rhodospirillaceae bacterium]MBT6088651.1 phosphotransferase [Rhodospirillaceae bacterium]MBT6961289.1 phosphotransferase [Rhodospirillaceae bacterium]MBT7450049.1 phosphotransferase [Rhodospirillaceae bacterium]
MVFPVIHSTLDPRALEQELSERYALSKPLRCQLISRANNDFYEVAAGTDRYALRVAKADFRSREAYAFEAAYVHHIHDKGCRVPGPVPAKDGSLFFEVEAPEGIRTITLMHWLDGALFTNALAVDDARVIGRSLAELHLAGADFTSDAARSISASEMVEERMPHLLGMLKSDPDHHDFYVTATKAVQSAYADMEKAGLPRGPVHGDYQFANVMRTQSGDLAALDFDSCGIGYLAEDLFTFIWRSDMEIKDESVNEAFISGYEDLRPLSDDERAYLGLFRVARDLVMSSTFAILINRVGPVPGFDGDFEPFTALTRKHLAAAGLA